MAENSVNIGGRLIGPGEPVYVIAEAGVNHNGDMRVARAMCRAAKDAGADAVKFQAFRCKEFLSENTPLAAYQRKACPWARSQNDMLGPLELSENNFHELFGYCQGIGIEFLASAFDTTSVWMLAEMGVHAIKLASPEITDGPVLRESARTGLPLIVSTGGAFLEEIREAVKILEGIGAAPQRDVILLHCVSAYPVPAGKERREQIAFLRDCFGLITGYSDHTTSVDEGASGVALGACVLEKHFTLSRYLDGPDHAMSLEPAGLRKYIRIARGSDD